MTRNPYQPPVSPLLPVTAVDTRKIGLRVGCAFAVPWLAALVGEAFGFDRTATSVAVNCLGLAAMVVLSIGSGGWWGRNIETLRWPGMLTAALMMALFWVLSFYVVMWAGFALASHSAIGVDTDALPIFMKLVGVVWIVSVAMACVVRWRVRRIGRLLSAAQDPPNG